ncbi:MAG: 3-hydroxybutyryl-CoA dehydrogenase [Actinomycetota bacterium]|nr:3-hydroxybutyryl-CoA dehydrogenase [Actinomycetota bacterium]
MNEIKPEAIKSVGIAGSGMMAAGIAEVAARAGFEVIVRGRSQASADAALGRVAKSFTFQVDKDKMTAADAEDALSRVRVTTDLEDLELCGLVVETVVEDLETKRQLFKELDLLCVEETIFATNTSTLAVIDLAMATHRPDRVVGLHFFNPAPRMPLVELVPALTTSDATVATARQFALDCGKEPVTVKDNAGFIVNALLFPYLNSAVRMLESSIASKEDIDAAMRGGCGYPMGPLELLDLVGLDTSLSILQALDDERHEAACTPAPLLRRMVTAQHLGRKTGQGFYSYPKAG